MDKDIWKMHVLTLEKDRAHGFGFAIWQKMYRPITGLNSADFERNDSELVVLNTKGPASKTLR